MIIDLSVCNQSKQQKTHTNQLISGKFCSLPVLMLMCFQLSRYCWIIMWGEQWFNPVLRVRKRWRSNEPLLYRVYHHYTKELSMMHHITSNFLSSQRFIYSLQASVCTLIRSADVDSQLHTYLYWHLWVDFLLQNATLQPSSCLTPNRTQQFNLTIENRPTATGYIEQALLRPTIFEKCQALTNAIKDNNNMRVCLASLLKCCGELRTEAVSCGRIAKYLCLICGSQQPKCLLPYLDVSYLYRSISS